MALGDWFSNFLGSIAGGIKDQLERNTERQRRSLFYTICAYLFILVSIGSFIIIGIEHAKSPEKFTGRQIDPTNVAVSFLSNYAEIILAIIVACLAFIFGNMMLRQANRVFHEVIPEQDRKLLEPLISVNNRESISQYIRLASLSGFSGGFTKIGLTGLPLTTVFLTVLLILLSLIPIEQAKYLSELAKLTLGAFIGSFVQRTAEQQERISTAVERLTAPPTTDGEVEAPKRQQKPKQKPAPRSSRKS